MSKVFSIGDFRRYGIEVPQGKGNVKVRCPRCGDSKKQRNRKDLSVHRDKGLWQCWSCDWKGSVMGGNEDHRPTYRPVQAPPAKDPTPVDDRFRTWLHQMRGIPQERLEAVIALYGLQAQAAGDYQQTGRIRVLFPHQAEGHTWAHKQRFVPVPNGLPKSMWCKVGDGVKFRQPIFGHHLLEGEAAPKAVLLTEGELDAVALGAIEPTHKGQPCAACSLGNAPSTNNWRGVHIPSLFESQEELNREGRYFLLAMDNDGKGLPFRDEVARRLGLHRCWIVSWPEDCKDANDVLRKHGAAGLQACIDEAVEWPLEDVKTARESLGDLLHVREHGYPVTDGVGLEALDRLMRLAPGQFWTWTGVPTHGKSNMLEFFALLNSVANGTRWAFYSPETPRTMFFHRLTEMLMGRPLRLHTMDGAPVADPLTQGEVQQAIDFLDHHFYYIEPADEAADNSLDWVLQQGQELVRRYGIDAVVIDPWNGLTHDYEQYEETRYISNSLEKVRAFRRQHQVSIHIVAHPKKVQYVQAIKGLDAERAKVPLAYDISGSSTWYDKSDLIVVQYRYFELRDPATNEVLQAPRSRTIVDKVKYRWWGKQGSTLWDYDGDEGTANNRFLPTKRPPNDSWVPQAHHFDTRSWLPPAVDGAWQYRSPFGGRPAAPNSGAAGPAFRPGQADSIVDSFTQPEADGDGDFDAPF